MPSIGFLAGGFVESFVIGGILYGLILAQGYAYFNSCERDLNWMKGLAGFVLFMETIHTCFLCRQLYFYAVLAIENPLNLGVVDWSIPVGLVFEILIEMVVDLFYLHCMWTFSKNVVLTTVTVLVFLARHATFLYLAAATARFHAWPDFEQPVIKANILATLILVVVLDLTIALTMVYYLNRSKSELRRTRSVVGWLVMYYVNTGVVMAALAIAILVAYFAASGSLLYAGLINMFAKVLANSFFAALNSRQVLRAKMATPVIIDTNAYNGSSGTAELALNSVRVEVSRETTKANDTL